MNAIALVGSSAFLVTQLAAQAPSFTTFGNPCPLDPPPLAALSLPRIGQTFQMQARSGGSTSQGYEGGVAAAVVMGLSNTTWLGQPLPLAPAALQALFPGVFSCGDVAVAADVMIQLPFQIPRGPVVVAMPIPNDVALVGFAFHVQAVDFRGHMTHQTLGLELGTAARVVVGL